jgi:hypothetical protein
MTSLASRRILRTTLIAHCSATAACVTSPVYWPNAVNTPQIMQRGDAEGFVSVSSEGFTQLQTSVAVTRRFAIIANANYIDVGCASCSKRQHRFAELGLGTFSTNIDDRTTTVFVITIAKRSDAYD